MGEETLLQIQALDLESARLSARKDRIDSGEEVRAAGKRAEEVESELGELKLSLDSLATEQRRLEFDVDAMTKKAQEEERRLYDGSVANAKELEAIQHEVSNLKARRTKLEDELLERMERREELETRIAQAERAWEDARAAFEEQGAQSARELHEIQGRLATVSAERERLAAGLDQDLLELYEDLRGQKKGVGAAALVDGVCQGCHERLSAVELDKLKRTEDVKRCEYCRRILVLA